MAVLIDKAFVLKKVFDLIVLEQALWYWFQRFSLHAKWKVANLDAFILIDLLYENGTMGGYEN